MGEGGVTWGSCGMKVDSNLRGATAYRPLTTVSPLQIAPCRLPQQPSLCVSCSIWSRHQFQLVPLLNNSFLKNKIITGVNGNIYRKSHFDVRNVKIWNRYVSESRKYSRELWSKVQKVIRKNEGDGRQAWANSEIGQKAAWVGTNRKMWPKESDR